MEHALYAVLVAIHVIAAVVGIGPAFVFPVIGKAAKTGSQLRFVFALMQKINVFPKTGGIALLASGAALMLVGKIGFSLMWLNVSLALFAVIEIIILGFLEPRMKKVGKLVMASQGEEIPAEFGPIMKKIAPLEASVHILSVVILILMATKPF